MAAARSPTPGSYHPSPSPVQLVGSPGGTGVAVDPRATVAEAVAARQAQLDVLKARLADAIVGSDSPPDPSEAAAADAGMATGEAASEGAVESDFGVLLAELSEVMRSDAMRESLRSGTTGAASGASSASVGSGDGRDAGAEAAAMAAAEEELEAARRELQREEDALAQARRIRDVWRTQASEVQGRAESYRRELEALRSFTADGQGAGAAAGRHTVAISDAGGELPGPKTPGDFVISSVEEPHMVVGASTIGPAAALGSPTHVVHGAVLRGASGGVVWSGSR